MKKILGLTIAALLVIAMVAAGTFAFFQDTETSTNNNITAGTLDLKINSADVNYNIIAALTNKKPGDADATAFASLTNSGTLTGKLTVAFGSVANIESATGTEFTGDILNDVSGTSTSGSATTLVDIGAAWVVNAYTGCSVVITGAGTRTILSNTATTLTFATGTVVTTMPYTIHVGELGAQIQIAPYIDVDNSGTFNTGDLPLKSDGTVKAFSDGLQYDFVNNFANRTYTNVIASFAPSANMKFFLPWQFNNPGSAVNSAQGDTFSVGITFTFDQ